MNDEIKQARECENELFKQLSETAESMQEKLEQDPETEKLLSLICAMDIMRATIADMESPDPETAAKGRERFFLLSGKGAKE